MALPTNLLSVNASEISGSIQSLAGQLPDVNPQQIQQYPILNTAIPDAQFKTGSFDEIRERTLQIAEQAIIPLRVTVPTFSFPSTVPRFSPKLPSFGQIKNFINTKIDRIKIQRQQASIKALKADIQKKENPFTYRKSLVANTVKSSVLGRFNT